MGRTKPLRKSYKSTLTWTEEQDSTYRDDVEWQYLSLFTFYQDKRYFVRIRTRHKWWGANKYRTCDMELYHDHGEDEDYYEPMSFGPYYTNIRIFDPQRYKHEALHWAEQVILSPLALLGLELDNLTDDKKDEQSG